MLMGLERLCLQSLWEISLEGRALSWGFGGWGSAGRLGAKCFSPHRHLQEGVTSPHLMREAQETSICP